LTERFTRSARINNARDYKIVFDQARRLHSPSLTVLVRRNETSNARLGLIVSRKCARAAVTRNRIKRLIRESFRREQSRLCGLDIVVISRATITKKTNEDVFSDLATLWNRIQPCVGSFST